MAERADVIVIGGGIAGVGVAAHLAPGARTVVLENESQPGHHASGRSAAIDLKNYCNPVIRALTRAGEAMFEGPRTAAPVGRLMVSPAEEDEVEPHDAWAGDMVLAEGLNRWERAVTAPVTRVEGSWAGLRTFAPDRTPVVGFGPAAEGFFWLAGQGGHGIQTAPALSRLAAALVLGAAPEAALEPLSDALSPDRFRKAKETAP